MSRVRASSINLAVYGNSALTDIQIPPPNDTIYSISHLIITVRALPTDGTIFLADGVTKVSVGEMLTVAQLAGLEFVAAEGLFGVSSTFAYSVTDPSGASARGAANITIAADSLPPVTTPVSLTVAENTNTTAIGIAAPIDPNYAASQLTVTVTELPSDGTVYLGDSTASASIGQTLTVAQLRGLTFKPIEGAFSQASSFIYKVSDPSGLSATGAAALIVGPAAPAAVAGTTDPALIVANGVTITIDGPSASAVTFAGTTGTLKLEAPQAFTGVVSGLSSADAIDLAGFAYSANLQATYQGNASGGTLTVSDGAETAHIALSGNYLSSSWTLSDDGNGGTTVVDPTLPPGVTLRQIDGGPNYYANNGLTYAHNAGWDNSDFFPIGAWAAPIQTTSDATRWAALGWNTAWVPAHANQSVIQTAGISLVISAQSGWTAYTNYGFTPGPETVGIETFDEPSTSAQFYNGMSTIPNSIQDGRFWWVNNTINWIDYGSPATRGTQAAWLGAPQTTPDGSTRTINIASLDYYPFSRNDQYGPPSISTTWGLSTTATSDQYRRGFFYHDVIDQERLYQPVSAPLMAIVENGGPFTTDTTSASYIQPSEMNWAVWESIIAGAREVMYFNNTFGGPGISNDDMNSTYFQSAQTEATFTGTGLGNSLTVSSVTGEIFLGDVVSGTGVPAGTTIVSQTSGTEGGAGVYVTSQAVTASGASLTANQPTSMYAQTAATDALIEQLAPVINSPFAEGYATVNPAPGEKLPLPLARGTGTSAFSGIDISVHWYTGGDISNRGLQLSDGAYIFAATRDSEYATNIPAIFTLADTNATSVTVVNENRTIPVINGVFTDTFATGATIHIYQVNDGSSVAPADFDGDGKSDILWRNANGAVDIWTDGDPNQSAFIGSVDTSWQIAGVGDFDGDGKSDILWRNTNGAVDIWTDGNANQSAFIGSVDTSWQIAGVGDFNGDGKSDILWRNTDGAVDIWTDGNANQSAFIGSVDTSWQIAGVGDFNGDGKSDILWRNTDGAVDIWTDGNPNQSALIGSVDTSWQIAGVGDFNGDGRSDILWRNTNGAADIWTDGNPNQLAFIGSVDTSWQIAGVGDFNGDGQADILWRNTNGLVNIWTSGNPNQSALIASVDSSWTIQAGT